MKRQRRVLITGFTGQDVSYLAELLFDKGYKMYGFVRRASNDLLVRFKNIAGRVKLLYGNMRDIVAIKRALEKANPDEIYNLASQSDMAFLLNTQRKQCT